MTRRAALVAVGLVGLVVGPALAAPEAVYVVTGDHLPIEGAFHGHVQSLIPQDGESVQVRVSAPLVPIGATAFFAGLDAAPRAVVPAGFRLPAPLAARLRAPQLEWEAATRVQEWVAHHLRVDEEDLGPQDAVSVLARGRGRCSGIANAAVALLLAAGFQARTVSGVLVTPDGMVPHRWLECRLVGAGWVSSDPTLGLWIVTPRHLRFDGTVERLPDIRVVVPGDVSLEAFPRRDGLPYRPNSGSSLVCRLTGGAGSEPAVACLRSATGDVRWARLDPRAEFTGLLPGPWMLHVELDGRVVRRVRLDLEQGGDHTYLVDVGGDAR